MSSLAADNKVKPAVAVEATPHRWAISAWARAFRRLGRRWFVTNHAREFCQPFVIEGAEHLESLRGPVLLTPNHTSHFDPVIVLSTLPAHIFDRTAIVAAADRHYAAKRWKAAWHSLRYNTFPITRGGGKAAWRASSAAVGGAFCNSSSALSKRSPALRRSFSMSAAGTGLPSFSIST